MTHNLWANRLILEACSALSVEQLATSVDGTYGALGPILAHLTAAEAGYVWRFDQAEDKFPWDEGDPVPAVEEMAKVLEQTGTTPTIDTLSHARTPDYQGCGGRYRMEPVTSAVRRQNDGLGRDDRGLEVNLHGETPRCRRCLR